MDEREREKLEMQLKAAQERVNELEEQIKRIKWTSELWNALVATSQIGIYILQEGRFKLVSTKFKEILGYEEEEILGKYCLDTVFPEDREKVRKNAISMLKGKRSLPYEYRAAAKDGQMKWVMETVAPVLFEGRQAVLGNFMDITIRKEAEEMRNLLYKVLEVSSSALTLEEFFQSIHEIVGEVMPSENFSVALYDPEKELVSFPYFVDEREERPSPRKIGKALIDYVIRTQEPLVATRNEIKRLIAKEGLNPPYEIPEALLAVPLKTRHKTIGAISLRSYSESVRYSSNEKETLSLLSRQVALTIEKRQEEDRLKETQALLSKVLDLSPVGIAFTEDRIVRWANKAMADMFRETSAGFINQSTKRYYASEEEGERVWKLALEHLGKGKELDLDVKFKRTDGSIFFGHLRATPFDSSLSPRRWIMAISDISWRKEMEAALYAEKERLAVTLRSIGDGVICTDSEGHIVLMNRVAEELTGWPEHEAIGKPLEEVFHIVNEKTRKRCENPVERVLQTGGVVGLANHTVLIAKDGTERILADSGAPIRTEDGEVIGVVLVFRDVTRQRKIEEELMKMEKLESIGVLAGGIAHDFNNILTAILGNIAIAKLHATSDPKLMGRLTELERATLHAKDLTQQLLTFARGGKPLKKPMSIAKLVEDSVSFALRGSNVRAEISIPVDLWPVEIDEGQINQVINNLVINAQQAMPQGGVINVEAENVIVGEKDALPLKPGRYVKISIEDHGIGIAKEHLPRIFDPYFTTKQKGSGLGLTTAYSIVKNHDGHITVESTLGKGTRFDIYLPASEKEVPPERAGEEEFLIGKGRVLFMDDEDIVRKVGGEMLRFMGYEVEFAKDGSEAIDLYLKAKKEGKPFDVVILDLTVPGGLGGKETLEELRKIDPGVKAIVSSGYSSDPIMADFRTFGFCEVLPKPYRLKTLAEVMRKVMEEGKE